MKRVQCSNLRKYSSQKNETNIMFSETLINLIQSFTNDSDLMFYLDEELIFVNQMIEEFSDYDDLINGQIFMFYTNHYE